MLHENLLELDDATTFGELMRNQVFPGPGVGCYSNFDVAPDMAPVNKSSELGRKLLAFLFQNCWWSTGEGEAALRRELVTNRVHLYASETAFVGWWWDGDGTLLGGTLDKGAIIKMAINGDCKKAYNWEWVINENH
ncbi:phosphoglucomutase [Novimethylophilus kurashikiensis]|uniref:Phosphoglucomutase n=1 Tax=Novimethylophilus kurashikiensis TaxID=1825523 RepID=A0A2R5F980_9PROT|nr:hypothetical protein [Novimethylophilus kurashikiensis]GBG14802.1 phosphoglucomutase [Novimethylophilus kurashikiensis]